MIVLCALLNTFKGSKRVTGVSGIIGVTGREHAQYKYLAYGTL